MWPGSASDLAFSEAQAGEQVVDLRLIGHGLGVARNDLRTVHEVAAADFLPLLGRRVVDQHLQQLRLDLVDHFHHLLDDLARQILEGARTAPFLTLTNVTNAPVNITSRVNGVNVNTQYFYDVSLVNSLPTRDLYYEASVVVRWSSGSVPGSGTNHTIQMDTVIPNR